MEAQLLKAHSNSHDWSWSSVELPGHGLSKGQVIQPPLGLGFPAVHRWWDNHHHTCHISLHLLWQERSDATQPAQPVIVSVWQRGIFYKHSIYYVHTLWRQGHDSLISCSRWKKIQRKPPWGSSRRRRPCLKQPSSYRYLKRINWYLLKYSFS